MAKAVGFDSEKYLTLQSEAIIKRIEDFDNKLYLEFGGKIIGDMHAARVLPGFDKNAKIRLLQKLKDKAEIIICIYAGDIERRKLRADFGITYDADVLKLMDELKDWGIAVRGVVVTRYSNQPSAKIFINKLERRGIKVFTHGFTKGYPMDVETIVSDEGYGSNAYIKTTKPLVVVIGPGPGSGKLATCLSQLYHDHKCGINSGYAKFETFPIWNIPLKHPVNVAYEAATSDIRDFNMIDPFHLEAYNKMAINYNRDVEVFPVIRRILTKIMGNDGVYKSPTDMGVNCAGFGIVNDAAVREASSQEIIRRYYKYSWEYAMGFVDKETVDRVQLIMQELGLKFDDRKVVAPALKAILEINDQNRSQAGILCGAAIELSCGRIITGKNSNLMHAASSAILNAVKTLAEVPDKIHILAPNVIESIGKLKKEIQSSKAISLDVEETLIALSISAATNPTAQLAMEKLAELKDCEIHLTHIPTPGDEAGLRKLGMNLTCEPNFATQNFFIA